MLDATHHWYSVMAVMAAVAVVLEERTPGRLALALEEAGMSVGGILGRGCDPERLLHLASWSVVVPGLNSRFWAKVLPQRV